MRVHYGRSSAANFKFYSHNEGTVAASSYDTSEEIFEELISELDRIQKSEKFRKRYLDMKDFKKVGRYIDWKSLTRL
jgi:hypothetical protein